MALDLTDDAAATGHGPAVLDAVSTALSDRDLDDALRRLAAAARDATGAVRCVVLLAEGLRLRLVAPGGGDGKGRARPSVDVTVDPDPALSEVLARPRPTVVDDPAQFAAAGALGPAAVPPGSAMVVVAPLTVGPDSLGAIVASWAQAPAAGAQAVTSVLGGLAAVAAAVVRHADAMTAASRWVHAQEVVAHAAVTLTAPLVPRLVTRHLADAYAEALAPRVCVVGVLDETHDNLVSVAARGTRKVRGTVGLADLPHHLVRRLCKNWAASADPVDVGDDRWLADAIGGRQAGARWYHLVPLSAEGRVAGAVVLGFDERRHLDDDDLDVVLALAELGDGALDRHAARQRQLQRAHELEVVARMAAAFVDAADRSALLARLRDVMVEDGLELVGLSYRDQRLARRLGSDETTPEEEAAWRSRAPVALPDGTLAVPLRMGPRPVGTLRLRPAEPTAAQRSLVDVVARALTDLSARRSLRLAFEEADRERALKEERDRLALDLHDTAGQLFVAIALLAHQDDEGGDGTGHERRLARVAELAERGKWELAQAVRALAFVPSTRHGLVPAVRALSRSLSADSGIEVLVDVNGRPSRLAPPAERALYRVAHEALTNAWRHARCAVIRVEVTFTPAEVTLHVVDDGLGLGLRQTTDPGHLGLTGMRRSLAEVGGSLRVRNARPRGVAVEARVARGAGAG